MPTGLVDRGEDIPQAVQREVLEETGLNVNFDRVLIVRQSHGLAFGRSDVFFVCACRCPPPPPPRLVVFATPPDCVFGRFMWGPLLALHRFLCILVLTESLCVGGQICIAVSTTLLHSS